MDISVILKRLNEVQEHLFENDLDSASRSLSNLKHDLLKVRRTRGGEV